MNGFREAFGLLLAFVWSSGERPGFMLGWMIFKTNRLSQIIFLACNAGFRTCAPTGILDITTDERSVPLSGLNIGVHCKRR